MIPISESKKMKSQIGNFGVSSMVSCMSCTMCCCMPKIKYDLGFLLP